MITKDDLFKEYPYRCELHAHTSPVSSCSEIPAKQVVENYYEIGCDVLVITNHFYLENFKSGTIESAIDCYMKDYEDARELGERLGMKVLLGAEIRFTENHNDYLIYGVDRELLRKAYDWLDKGIVAFSKEFRTDSTILLQAHPFRDHIVQVNPDLLDGMEVANMHPNHNSRVAKATQYAKQYPSWITTAGTDYHHLTHEGMAFLRMKQLPQDSNQLIHILRSKDYIFEIGQNSIMIP